MVAMDELWIDFAGNGKHQRSSTSEDIPQV